MFGNYPIMKVEKNWGHMTHNTTHPGRTTVGEKKFRILKKMFETLYPKTFWFWLCIILDWKIVHWIYKTFSLSLSPTALLFRITLLLAIVSMMSSAKRSVRETASPWGGGRRRLSRSWKQICLLLRDKSSQIHFFFLIRTMFIRTLRLRFP